MGKTAKHPTLCTFTCTWAQTHTPAFICGFEFLHPCCPGGVNFCYLCFCFFYWVYTIAVRRAPVRVSGCTQVTSVPSEVRLILHSEGSHEQGSSMCQHGASLTFGVLLKVLMEGTLRGLCPLQPSCGSASPLLTAQALSLKTGRVCAILRLGQGHLDGSPGLVCSVEVQFEEEMELRHHQIF